MLINTAKIAQLKIVVCVLLAALLLLFTAVIHSEFSINFPVFKQQLSARFHNTQAQQRVIAWQQLLEQLKDKSDQEKLLSVNQFFHEHVRYIEDIDLYQSKDYWASPLELLGHGSGDCEDWVIGQYASLRYLGISEEKLRLIYVRASVGGPHSSLSQAHMVLGYYQAPSAQPLILDSLIRDVLPAKERPDLKPVFSFNSAGLWVGQGEQRAKSSPTARLSPWRDVLERMQNEGIKFY